MKLCFGIMGFWSLYLLGASIWIFGLSSGYYPFTFPFIALAAACALLAIAGFVASQIRSVAFWVVAPIHGMLIFPYAYAIHRWPGADDGPGMAWNLFVGGGSCIAVIIAVACVVVTLVGKLRTK